MFTGGGDAGEDVRAPYGLRGSVVLYGGDAILFKKLPLLLVLWAVVCCAGTEQPTLDSAQTPLCSGTVKQVVFEDFSGTIPIPYSEHYTITLDEIRFERMGAQGEVNSGVWAAEAPPGSVQDLFDKLGALDCRQIERIVSDGWPEIVPVGGGRTHYRIEYEDGSIYELRYGEGITYINAQAMTRPIREFLRTLRLPAAAWEIYLDP